MTNALITGITGFVGSHLADLILEQTDWNVVGMCRWRSPLNNINHLVHRINDGNGIRLIYADLRDTIAVQKAVKDSEPDYVFHLAAQSYPQTSFNSELDTFETNILGTTRLLDAIKTANPKAFIHVCSSSEVYGRAKVIPIKEDTPFHPASPYAISKVGTDLVGRYYAEAHGLNVQVTRMFTHTGPRRGDVFFESSFAKQIAMIEAKQIPPVVKVGNLNSMRTICDVRDAVRAYYMLLTVNPVAGSVYNIGGDYSATVGDILKTLISMSDVDISIEQDPKRMRPIDADLQVPDCTLFKNHTGWEPSYKFEQTMTDLLNYWRNEVRMRWQLQR